MLKRLVLVLAVLSVACDSPTAPSRTLTAVEFRLDAACPSPLLMDFQIDGDGQGPRLVTTTDSVRFDIEPGAHTLGAQLIDQPFSWLPQPVTVRAGGLVRMKLTC